MVSKQGASSENVHPFLLAASIPGVDFPAGYKHAINWIPDSFVVDATVTSASESRLFSLGAETVVKTTLSGSAIATSLPLTVRAVASWGVSEDYVYGNFAPNVPGAANALFLHIVPLGWTDLLSYSGSGANTYSQGAIGNSFMVDVKPGTNSMQDAPLFPGDSFAYGAWYSPASGQNASAAGTANGVANTTTLLLFENLGASGFASLSLRTTTISASTGERPEGRGCDLTGCAAAAVPQALVCGSAAVTVSLTSLNPVAMWRVSLPSSAAGAPQMATFSTCTSSGATELGAYRSIPFAQVCAVACAALMPAAHSARFSSFIDIVFLWRKYRLWSLCELQHSGCHDGPVASTGMCWMWRYTPLL